MPSFLVLRSTSPPIKQAGNPAFLPFLAPGGHTISRRSAAGSCTDVQDTPRQHGERIMTAWRTHHASSFEQLPSCRASWKHGCSAAATCHARAEPLPAAGGSRRRARSSTNECAIGRPRVGCRKTWVIGPNFGSHFSVLKPLAANGATVFQHRACRSRKVASPLRSRTSRRQVPTKRPHRTKPGRSAARA